MDFTKEGMAEGMMRPHNPRELLNIILRNEQMEVSLYKELAQSAPSRSLKQVIKNMAEEEACQIEMLQEIAAAYGFAAAGPPVTHDMPIDPSDSLPHYFATGENEEKK